MDRRSLFCWSREFTGGLTKGGDYSLLSNVIAINIVNFVNSLPDKDIKNNSLHRWLTFFDQNISDDTLKELMDMDTAIYKANEKWNSWQMTRRFSGFTIYVKWHSLTITAA